MNLIICHTPLQVLIAEKIIDMYPNEEFMGFFIFSLENPKNIYYANRLKERVDVCHFLSIKNTELNKKDIRQTLKWFKNYFYIRKLRTNVDKVFLSNAEFILVQKIISLFHINEIYTFDDGTRNLTNYNGNFVSPKLKLFLRILGIKEDFQSILQKSLCHYTIYSFLIGKKDNIKKIELFPNASSVANDMKEITILLGQPIFFNEDNKNKKLFNKVLSVYQVDYYFPHPRESYIIDNVEYIDTPLIFEDYFMKNFLDCRVKVLTFFSSVALNLMNADNVEIVSLYHSDINEKLELEIYDVFKQLNINMVDISDM